jgi:type IV secretory pathway VirD2 relaxase
MANKAYKMHISLSEREFRQLGLTSWKPIVREAMENLQQKWGKQFDWIVAEHMATGHPHVHLVIKAVYRDESGRHRQLRLDKQHLDEIKRETDRVIERRRVREQERVRPLQMVDTLLRAFDRALREIIAADREDEHEVEQAHQRWLRKRPPRESDDHDRGR